jgi:hypothetical protein
MARKARPAHEPRLADNPTLKQARTFMRGMVRWMGPGFHPDTDFNEYVISETGEPSFLPAKADELNEKVSRAMQVLEDSELDPYEDSCRVQRRMMYKIYADNGITPA